MKPFVLLPLLCLVLAAHVRAQSAASPPNPASLRPVLVVHGGAGVIRKADMQPERERAIRNTLAEALRRGYAVLDSGGTALEAVTLTVTYLENSGVFNAGKGAVRTTTGAAELDAAIMDGASGQAGAVAGLTTTRNPVQAACAVMARTPHVLLIGPAADAFAKQQGLEQVRKEYFEARPTGPAIDAKHPQNRKHGTVGAVALDRQGNLAAATSTGGTAQKLPGRVGDVPLIGAGTYAANGLVAISCTGHGEYFIRQVVAHDVAARMKYVGQSVGMAAQSVIDGLTPIGGSGGLIAVDSQGNIAMPFNSAGMIRGYARGGEVVTAIYSPAEEAASPKKP